MVRPDRRANSLILGVAGLVAVTLLVPKRTRMFGTGAILAPMLYALLMFWIYTRMEVDLIGVGASAYSGSGD